MTQGHSQATVRQLARKVGVNSFLLMMGAAVIGTYVLEFFGLSLPAVQVGGGLVLVSSGWKLLQREDPGPEEAQAPDGERVLSRAFYPFTLPLTIGPGSISVALTLGATLPQRMAQKSLSPLLILGLTLGIAIMSFVVFWMYASAERVGKAIGPTATNVMLRLSSFILLCIGVQITWNGLIGLAGPHIK